MKQVVRAGKYGSFIFEVDPKKTGFHIQVYLKVLEVGMDIGANLLPHPQYEHWLNWFTAWTAWKLAPSTRQKPVLPTLPAIYRERTNIVDKGFDLGPGAYMLLLDNTYSQVNDKTVDVLLTMGYTNVLEFHTDFRGMVRASKLVRFDLSDIKEMFKAAAGSGYPLPKQYESAQPFTPEEVRKAWLRVLPKPVVGLGK